MKYFEVGITAITISLVGISCNQPNPNNKISVNSTDLMTRIAEIEIDSAYLDEYIAILKKESQASVQHEPGVICIFPMFQKESPTSIRLLEIYASKEAYEAHLQTPHFQHYKTSTLKMVKSLRLVEMEPIDKQTMNSLFEKLNP